VAIRRFLTLQALLLWQGGFVFYAAVVVPVGTDVLGSSAMQGAVTQQVTNWLNRLGVAALCILAWDVAFTSPRRTIRWITWGGTAGLLAVLFFLHAVLDSNFDSTRKISADPATFKTVHITYLWVSTIQWLLSLVFAWSTLRAWALPPLEHVSR